MILAVRHYPDRKRPCLVLEEGNKAVVLGYLTDKEREGWLRKAFDCGIYPFAMAISPCKYTIETLLSEGEVTEDD